MNERMGVANSEIRNLRPFSRGNSPGSHTLTCTSNQGDVIFLEGYLSAPGAALYSDISFVRRLICPNFRTVETSEYRDVLGVAFVRHLIRPKIRTNETSD